ncbi:MAG: hypothetical protein M1838_001107 [Thelocarpon superellum]|nr:MAG: hypothetical protein M1838_001107 [Thelocarpon superellum]
MGTATATATATATGTTPGSGAAAAALRSSNSSSAHAGHDIASTSTSTSTPTFTGAPDQSTWPTDAEPESTDDSSVVVLTDVSSSAPSQSQLRPSARRSRQSSGDPQVPAAPDPHRTPYSLSGHPTSTTTANTTTTAVTTAVTSTSTNHLRSARPSRPSPHPHPHLRPHPSRRPSSSAASSDASPHLIRRPSNGRRPRSSPSTTSGPVDATALAPTVVDPAQSSPIQSGSESRSPGKHKRAPASWSSHGIETSKGPPPALSTQRSYAADLTRHGRDLNDPTTPTTIPSAGRGSASRREDMDPAYPHRYGEDLLEDDRDRTLRALEGHPNQDVHAHTYLATDGPMDTNGSDLKHSAPSTEDLFLNLARATSQREADLLEASTRAEKRRSRLGLPAQHQAGASNSFSSPLTAPNRYSEASRDYGHQPTSQERIYQHARRISQGSSLARARSSAASAHPLDDAGRARYFSRPSRASFSTPRNVRGPLISPESHAYSAHSPATPESPGGSNLPTRSQSHSHHQSNLSYGATRNFSSRLMEGPPPPLHQDLPTNYSHADGTESTVSTTPASTMWDELEGLKSRIHHLEAKKGAHSNGSGERPRTATTTGTTISSSPKHVVAGATSPGASSGTPNGVPTLHPLLNAALAKSKPVLGAELYRALEATASDAVSIAAMTGGVSPGTSSARGNSISSERQLRRKADGLCRSLTELCLALTDAKSDTGSPMEQAQRRRSRDTTTGYGQHDGQSEVNAGSTPRTDAREADPMALVRSNSRALSRVEARRSSLMAMSSGNSPRPLPETPPTATSVVGPNTGSFPDGQRSKRSSVVLRSLHNDAVEDTASDVGYRAPSRAVTEVSHGHMRSSPREYTSQHPLPEARRMSSSLQSSLPLRRHLASSSVSSSSGGGTGGIGGGVALNSSPNPHTPPLSSNNRRYLDRTSPAAYERRATITGKGPDEHSVLPRGSSYAFNEGVPARTGSVVGAATNGNAPGPGLGSRREMRYQR